MSQAQAPTTMQWLRTAGTRVRIGTGVLARRLAQRGTKAGGARARGLGKGIGGWLGESTGILDTAVRWGMLAAAAWVASVVGRLALGMGAHALAGARWLMWPATAVYVVAAYRAGGKEPDAEEPAASEPDGPELTAPTAPPIVPRTVFLALLHGEIGEGRAVHLAHLARVLGERGPAYAWDVPAVAALCAAHGIPVEPKARAHGKGATRAVLKSALPPPSEVFSWAPSAGVDVAGQESSTASSTSTSTGLSTGPEVGGGEGFVTVPDDANPHRSHIRWYDQT